MVHIAVEYQGDLHCAAQHGPSSATLSTDAPTDNHGRGESFSPTDLAATALGSCMLTVMGIKAKQLGVEIAGATTQVEKIMAPAPDRKIRQLIVQIDMPAGVPEGVRSILETAANTCPVKQSLHPDIDVPVAFTWL